MELFIKKLNYLGATLGLSPEIDSYVDLEEFFLESSLYINTDSRVKQAILNWIYRYSCILSPSKIRRMLKFVEYDKVVVNQIVLLLLADRVVKTNWNILVTMKHLEAISFKSNEKKYLKSNQFILKTVPEIRLRAEGRTQGKRFSIPLNFLLTVHESKKNILFKSQIDLLAGVIFQSRPLFLRGATYPTFY